MVHDGMEWSGSRPDVRADVRSDVRAGGGSGSGGSGDRGQGPHPGHGTGQGAGNSTGHTSGLESNGTPGHGAGRRVLVIEDEPNISEAIRFILRRDGWDVGTHDTGDGALARIEAERPDLVILDVMLPGQSGLDILQALRARPDLADLPVILLTARGQAATRDLAQGYGASMFMAKPFANADLLAAVRQLVGV